MGSVAVGLVSWIGASELASADAVPLGSLGVDAAESDADTDADCEPATLDAVGVPDPLVGSGTADEPVDEAGGEAGGVDEEADEDCDDAPAATELVRVPAGPPQPASVTAVNAARTATVGPTRLETLT